MEIETSDIGSKLLGGGVWTALGVFLSAAVNYWRDKKKDDSQNTFNTLGAINQGSKELMNSLLQAQKLLDESLRRTRNDLDKTRDDLRRTQLSLESCEAKHHDAEQRLIKLETTLQPVAKGE